MHQIDSEVFDELLAELFTGNRTYAVYVAETLRHILGEEVADSNDFYYIYPLYMAELKEHGLATERGTATIMDITSFGRQVHKAGGWQAYLKRQEEKAEQARIKELADKRWSRSEVIAGLAWGVFQYVDSQEKDDRIQILQDSLKVVNQQLIESINLYSLPQQPPKQGNDTLRSPNNRTR